MWFIFIFANGTALFLLNITVTVAVVNITLPTAAVAPPLVQLDGVAVPALYVNNTIILPTGGGGVVTVKYVPRVETNGFLSMDITTRDVFLIWAERGVLLTPHMQILNFTSIDHALLVAARGPGKLEYAVLKPPSVVTSIDTPLNTPTATWTTTPIGAANTPNANNTPQIQTYIPLLAGVATAVLVAASLYRRRRRVDGLSEVDISILNYVRSKSGAFESEIARDLGIPRTTVFRAVRRLEESGFIKVEKREGKNWIKPNK